MCTFLRYGWDAPSKLVFVHPHQDSCLVMSDNTGISARLGRAIGTLLEERQETECLFSVATGMLGFLSMFKGSQASSHFGALDSVCLLRCQRVVRPPVEMRRGLWSFSRVSAGH